MCISTLPNISCSSGHEAPCLHNRCPSKGRSHVCGYLLLTITILELWLNQLLVAGLQFSAPLVNALLNGIRNRYAFKESVIYYVFNNTVTYWMQLFVYTGSIICRTTRTATSVRCAPPIQSGMGPWRCQAAGVNATAQGEGEPPMLRGTRIENPK